MRRVTRESARIDRVACPWLLACFIERLDLADPALRNRPLFARGADCGAAHPAKKAERRCYREGMDNDSRCVQAPPS